MAISSFRFSVKPENMSRRGLDLHPFWRVRGGATSNRRAIEPVDLPGSSVEQPSVYPVGYKVARPLAVVPQPENTIRQSRASVPPLSQRQGAPSVGRLQQYRDENRSTFGANRSSACACSERTLPNDKHQTLPGAIPTLPSRIGLATLRRPGTRSLARAGRVARQFSCLSAARYGYPVVPLPNR